MRCSRERLDLKDVATVWWQLYRSIYDEVCVCGQGMRGILEIDLGEQQKREGELATIFKG